MFKIYSHISFTSIVLKMETIQTYLRGTEYFGNDKHKLMERVDWLAFLRKIFNRASNSISLHSSRQTITVEAFLNTLLETADDLPLLTPDEYYRKTNAQAYSLENVFNCF